MRYVIIRDDDTNAYTPIECLERLYRPFLDAGLPVSLATIPAVSSNASMRDGQIEGFLIYKNGTLSKTATIGENPALVQYLLENEGYKIVQHGLHHDFHEFDHSNSERIAQMLVKGTLRLMEAGFPRPETFVAPYDRLSRAALAEVAKRFPILSTGWFELRRLPVRWWPRYVLKKVRAAPHWRAGGIILLSHPGCLLSYHRTYDTMLANLIHHL